jgi:hypothetical protein
MVPAKEVPMKKTIKTALICIVAAASTGCYEMTNPGAPAESWRAEVIINGVPLDDREIAALGQACGHRVAPGAYWYDRMCGAWGIQGGPTRGFFQPGLFLGGPLLANASNGQTGVFINGRQLPLSEVSALQQITTVVQGRFWLDAQGNVGYEGYPASGNLIQMARQAGGGSGGNQGQGHWSYYSRNTDAGVGGDGAGFYYYIDKDTSWNP